MHFNKRQTFSSKRSLKGHITDNKISKSQNLDGKQLRKQLSLKRSKSPKQVSFLLSKKSQNQPKVHPKHNLSEQNNQSEDMTSFVS